MNKEEIIEGNKLIAEFMGETNLTKVQHLGYKAKDRYGKSLKEEATKLVPYIPDYQSWNKLMPVVQKIESLGFTVSIFSGCCDIESKDINSSFDEIANGGGQPKILSTWKSCIQFIQWYNKSVTVKK